jgi:NADH-quinone oxidoreductase subunit N
MWWEGSAVSSSVNISYLAIGPEILLTLGAVLVLMIDVFRKPSMKVHAWIVVATLAATGVVLGFQWHSAVVDGATLSFSGMLSIDTFGAYAGFVLVGVAALGLAAAWGMMDRLGRRGAEGIVLVFMAAAGFMLMATSVNLVLVFVGLEIASMSLYVLAGITRQTLLADEAALKYFLLGSFASAVFVYGAALAFAGTGSLSMYGIHDFLAANVLLKPGVVLIGMALLIVGVAFKVSAAPFHVWAPDAYQGSPAGIVGFMVAAAKVGAFAALARILAFGFSTYAQHWATGLSLLAAISIVVGMLLAVVQTDIRRMLAYSSIAHAGFILTALTAGNVGITAMLFYVAVYAVQVIGAFAVVAAIAGPEGGSSPLSSYTGLSERSPLLAGSLAFFMIAMSGVPLTSGFVAKFAAFTAAWSAGFGWLVILAVVTSVVGFFFYLRVIVLMYMQEPVHAEAPGAARAALTIPAGIRWVLIITVAVTLVLGVVPGLLLRLAGQAFLF